jgi:hypothetical protein
MSRLFTRINKDGLHSHNALSFVLEFLASKFYLAVIGIRASVPTISTVATTDANWTLVATGLSNILEWRLSELNGNDFHYAYVATPGNNFSVGFGWVSFQTSPTAIYVKRPATANITIKLERWTA